MLPQKRENMSINLNWISLTVLPFVIGILPNFWRGCMKNMFFFSHCWNKYRIKRIPYLFRRVVSNV